MYGSTKAFLSSAMLVVWAVIVAVVMLPSYVNSFTVPSAATSSFLVRQQQHQELSNGRSTSFLNLKSIDVDDENDNKNNNDDIIQNRRDVLKRAASAAVITASGIASTSTFQPAVANAASDSDSYGPLADFVGKWVGNQGFVMIAVPSPGSEPKDAGDFFIKKFPYREEFVIEKVGDNVLQVGGSLDQISSVLKYKKTVWATPGPGDPMNEVVIHEENGMFFYLPKIVKNPDDGKPVRDKDEVPYKLGRSAVIPHGNTAMMFGDVVGEQSVSGSPTIPFISTEPTASFPASFISALYKIPYFAGGENSINEAPTKALRDALATNGPVKDYMHIAMTTDQKYAGGLLNTDFIQKRADTRTYTADFWIESLENGKMQMQYSEVANIFFHFNKRLFLPFLKSEIDWPHVMVNTLTKV